MLCAAVVLAKNLTVSATFRDTAGSRDEVTKMISENNRGDSPLHFIVVWKFTRSSMPLEETIELQVKLRKQQLQREH